jgi:cytoskeletal protein RodZ
VHVNSSDNIFRRFAVVAAVVATFLLFGASGAQAASTQVLAASGSLATQDHDSGDEETDDPSDEETEDPDNEDSDDEDSDDEDSDDEDSDNEETDEPTDEPTFTEPPTTDPTEDTTEMPTEDAGATSEEGPTPLGWVLLAGGVASAAAAFLVYRRNRPL